MNVGQRAVLRIDALTVQNAVIDQWPGELSNG
jgi:hypothetical protein